MKKIYLTLAMISVFLLIYNPSQAVPAYPYPIIYTQPDNSTLKITLQGDEKVRWALSEDGYTLLINNEGYFEYATLNTQGDLICSGTRANNISNRTAAEKSFLQTTVKGLIYSSQQVSILKSMWEIEKSEREKVFPTTGSRKLLCILMGYADLAFTKTQTDFLNLFNQVSYTTDGATGSVKDYYTEVSYNQFDLTVDIAGPYTANYVMAYYGANTTSGYDVRPRELVTEAVNLANPDVDYADYDNDNDGSVDGIYVIFAGYGEEAGAPADAIWSHAWSISPVTLDGKVISRYSCSPELRNASGTGITRIGVICHEFGHVLGAPDYYDTDYSGSGGEFSGTGKWDIMASGSWNNQYGITPAHHNAYTKVYVYNWATATVLSAPSSLALYNSEDNTNSFYRFNTPTSNEYFLMETRVQTGFDSYISGEGLIIYHVHSGIAAAASSNTINVGHPQMMYPVCASATSDPDSDPQSYGSINSTGCPFPGSTNKTEFTDATTPSARSWAGANTGQPLTNIVFSGASDLVTLDYMGGDPTVGGEDCSDAKTITGASGSIDYSTTGFTDDYTGSCGDTGEDRVYYLTKMIDDGDSLAVWITNDDYDVSFFVTYGSCGGTEIGCLNDTDTLTWINNTGSSQYVWIFVDGYGGSDGSATLNWNVIEQGDDCFNPIIISGTSGTVAYSTTSQTDNYTSSCGGDAEDMVFFLDTPVPDGYEIQFKTVSDNYNVVLYGRLGSCDGTEIACVNDPDGTELTWRNTTGSEQYVWLFADGNSGSSGNASLQWEITTASLPGNNCSSSEIISGTSGNVDVNTIGYSNEHSGSCESSGAEIVFMLGTAVEADKRLQLWTTDHDFDITLYASYGSCGGTEIGCVDEPAGSLLEWENTTGGPQFVWIFVDGASGAEGNATLNWNIAEPTGIENPVAPQATLYPNPAMQRIYIELTDGALIDRVAVYNLFGSMALQHIAGDSNASKAEVDISSLPEGTYLVDIYSSQSVCRKKLLVVR